MEIGNFSLLSARDSSVDRANAKHDNKSHVDDPCDSIPKSKEIHIVELISNAIKFNYNANL